MRAVLIDHFVHRLVSNVPTPSLSDNELCVKVTGAGVNFVDTLYVSKPIHSRPDRPTRSKFQS